MNDKKISVVLPVYNGGKYLRQSIESVLNQTYKNLELIIVNDCSTDNTKSIVQEYLQRDNRVKLINNPENYKLPKSLNVGFNQASGEYYTWTSDDNYYELNALQKMKEKLDHNPDCVCVCSDFEKIYEHSDLPNEIYRANPSPSEILKTNCVGACFLYRRDSALKIGGYDENKYLVEDYDHWLKLMLQGEFAHIDEILYHYRVHPECLSLKRANDVKVKAESLPAIYYEAYKKRFPELAKYISALKRKKLVRKITNHLYSSDKNESKRYIRVLGIKFSFKRKSKIRKKIDYLKKYESAKKWIQNYTVNGNGIAVESNQPEKIYPEVTGYYIPTLLKWGDRERAVNFGKYLLTIQNEDGSWNEPNGKVAYTFDTGQILKGLAALIENHLDENGEFRKAFIKGADWILTMQREDGSIATPDYSCWNLHYNKIVPESIHIYCLAPLKYAGKITSEEKYDLCVKRALNFYLSQESLTDFTTLSHFNAYTIEGLIDIGETGRAQRAMDLISLYQREDGSVSAYSNVDFVCSTGLLQYVICWYKLGEIEKADKAFDFASSLQNKSGGFFGSYTLNRDKANYFEKGEISWAVKYFLDAIYYRQKAKYEKIAHIFPDEIDKNDERYTTIAQELNNEKYIDVLDLGCGKGRYTKKLLQKYPNKKFHCVDLSSNVLKYIKEDVILTEGSILNIPFPNDSFDFVFVTEALEHSIDVTLAVKETTRVLKQGGKVVYVDKNKKALGKLQLADFEQWFDEKELSSLLEQNNFRTQIKSNLMYEDGKRDGLFTAWIGEKQ